MNITLIAAMTKHGVIGKNGQMPWHLPDELQHFKAVTIGKPILMGRKTFASIGRALPKRRNLVLSQQANLALPGCEVYSSLNAALESISPDEELMVIGGATLYTQTLPLAQCIYLTLVDCEEVGDVYFPKLNLEEWQEISRQSYEADAANQYAFQIVQLRRREP